MRYLRPSKDPSKLYYYCKLFTALELILPNSRILLSPIMKTNDPRENKPPLFTYNSNQPNGSIGMFDLNEKCNQALKGDCKVICFSKDFRNYQGCHLSKMWAQYGDNHKGICLELDRQLFISENLETIDKSVFKDINYFEPDYKRRSTQLNINLTKYELEGNFEYLRKDFRQKNLDQLYFTKNDEWESESEVRLLTFSDVTADEYCSIENSLVGIYLGVDFNNSYLPAIEEFSLQRYLYQIVFLHESLVSQSIRRKNFS